MQLMLLFYYWMFYNFFFVSFLRLHFAYSCVFCEEERFQDLITKQYLNLTIWTLDDCRMFAYA